MPPEIHLVMSTTHDLMLHRTRSNVRFFLEPCHNLCTGLDIVGLWLRVRQMRISKDQLRRLRYYSCRQSSRRRPARDRTLCSATTDKASDFDHRRLSSPVDSLILPRRNCICDRRNPTAITCQPDNHLINNEQETNAVKKRAGQQKAIINSTSSNACLKYLPHRAHDVRLSQLNYDSTRAELMASVSRIPIVIARIAIQQSIAAATHTFEHAS